MKLMKILSALGTSLILIGTFTPAQATSTDVVLNLEGNPTCSSLGPNSDVLGIKDPDPGNGPGGERTLTLPLPNGSQKLVYTVDQLGPDGYDRIKEWKLTEVTSMGVTYTLGVDEEFFDEVYPINYNILKAQGGNYGAIVSHFGANDTPPGSPGAIEDTDEASPGPNLTAVSFCYGLTKGFEEPEPPIVLADLPDCEELDPIPGGSAGDLFTTGIICPSGIDPEEQLIINMSLNDPRFGFDVNNDTIRACTCNSKLKPCNPALAAQLVNDLGQYLDEMGNLIEDEFGNPITADDLSQEDRTCLEFSTGGNGGVPTGVNERVPFHIEGVENPDSYICYTIDGVRTCYGHY